MSINSVPIEALSRQQFEIVAGLAAGLTVAELARKANISRQTIYNWQEQPNFAGAVVIAKQLHADDIRDQMLILSRKALKRIEAIIDDPKAPPSVALKASLAVLNRPQFPEQGWNLPANVNTPRQERIQEMTLAIEIDMKKAELENLQRKLMMSKIKAEAAKPPVGQNLTPSQPVNPVNPPPQPPQTQTTGQNLTPNDAAPPQTAGLSPEYGDPTQIHIGSNNQRA